MKDFLFIYKDKIEKQDLAKIYKDRLDLIY